MTDADDFNRFESFLNEMTETEFNIWYSSEAKTKQRELADKIREEVEQEDVGKEFRKRSSLIEFLRRLLK